MNFWIFQSLGKCKSESHSEAFFEVGTIILTSLVPVWVGMFVAAATSKPGGASLVLDGFLRGNEAVLYCAALLGPLAYTITKSYGKLPHNFTLKFPHALFFILVLFVIYGAAVGILGTDLAVSADGKGDARLIHSEGFRWISILFLVVSTSIIYMAYALRNEIPPDATRLMHEGSEDFLKEWQK